MNSASIQVIVAFVFGVSFITALIVLAIKFAQPTPFQYNVFRTVLSLAAAGIAAMIPGFINLQLSAGAELLIRAGGALAVFVITFFFNPARLASHVETPRVDYDPASVRAPSDLAEGTGDGKALSPVKQLVLGGASGAEDEDEVAPTVAAPPNPPDKLRDGNPFTPEERRAFFEVWECLVKVDRAGEELWCSISDITLSNFADRRREAQERIESNGLLFPEEVYDALREMMRTADFYLGGKSMLADIRNGRVFSDYIVTLAKPGENDRFVTDEVRHQIQQNKRWLTRYRTLLKETRSSFRRDVGLAGASAVHANVPPSPPTGSTQTSPRPTSLEAIAQRLDLPTADLERGVRWWQSSTQREVAAQLEKNGEWKFFQREPDEVRWEELEPNDQLRAQADKLYRDRVATLLRKPSVRKGDPGDKSKRP